LFDYIVIGTGIVNMACALHLSRDKSKKILLIEAGGFDYSEDSISHYDGKSFGHDYLPLKGARQRMFGGGYNCWGRRLKTFDQWDFNNDYSTWPIERKDFEQFEKKAFEYLVSNQELHYYKKDLIPYSQQLNNNFKLHFYQWADKYHYQYLENNIEGSNNLFLIVDQTLTRMFTDSKKITGIETTDSKKNKKKINGKVYIIGTGAIENCRTLIYNNVINNYQLFKNHDLIGRYWSDRPEYFAGELVMSSPFFVKYIDSRSWINFSMTDEAKKRFNLVNSSIRAVVNRLSDPRLIKEKTRRLICEVPQLKNFVESIRGDLLCFAFVKSCLETLPNAENRVTLSEFDKDRFGVPLTKLFFKQSTEDYENHRNMMIEFGKYLIDNNYGRLKIDNNILNYESSKSFKDTYDRMSKWKFEDMSMYDGNGVDNYKENEFLYSWHHMGGTRMGRNEKEGVVDENLKVFGQQNLYMNGASVFPSFGFTNPTFPGVQLSIRLADHLLKKTI
jgi:hypothetical protein